MLTADEPELLRRVIPKKELRGTFVPVEPELWARWGLTNPRREGVPYPSTIVVAPDGTIVLRETHVNYKVRARPELVLARIAEHRASGRIASIGQAARPAPGPVDVELDWDGALTVSAVARPGGLDLTLRIADGFHVYGTREENARPIGLRLDGHPGLPVSLPEGQRKDLGDALGEAWVLTGTQVLRLDLAELPPTAAGELDVQLCTDSACSRPRTLRWSLAS